VIENENLKRNIVVDVNHIVIPDFVSACLVGDP